MQTFFIITYFSLVATFIVSAIMTVFYRVKDK